MSPNKKRLTTKFTLRFLIVLLLSLNVLLKPSVAQTNQNPNENIPSLELDAITLFQLLASEFAIQREQAATGFATYLSLAKKTKDPRLAKRALEIAIQQQITDQTLEAARLWSELAPNNPIAQQALTTLQISKGQIEEAKPKILEKFKADKLEYQKSLEIGKTLEYNPFEQAQRQVLRSDERELAYEILLEVFQNDLDQVEAQRILANQAYLANFSSKAVEHATKLLELQDTPTNALILIQYLEISSENSKTSIEVLESFLKRHPLQTEIMTALARLYINNQNWAKARAWMETIATQTPENPEHLFILAGLCIQQNDRYAAKQFLNQYLKLPDNEIERNPAILYVALGQLFEENQEFEEALYWLEQVTKPNLEIAIHLRRALLLGKLNQHTSALKLVRSLNGNTEKEQIQIILTEAQLLREQEQTEAAISVITKAIQLYPNHPDLLYEQAMLAEKLNQMELMEDNLRRVIALQPNNPHAYNALGYALADRNLRLDEAKTLIEKAIELAPDDAFILDSLGWVFFKIGNHQQALSLLQKAYRMKADAEIAIHLGEILWVTGDSESAKALWRSVIKNANTADVLKKTLIRLGIEEL